MLKKEASKENVTLCSWIIVNSFILIGFGQIYLFPKPSDGSFFDISFRIMALISHMPLFALGCGLFVYILGRLPLLKFCKPLIAATLMTFLLTLVLADAVVLSYYRFHLNIGFILMGFDSSIVPIPWSSWLCFAALIAALWLIQFQTWRWLMSRDHRGLKTMTRYAVLLYGLCLLPFQGIHMGNVPL